ncbi:MAG: PorT family protein, partial [Flavobacteriia bacterium]
SILFAQDEVKKDSIIDYKYLEDQIYINASYQKLMKLPDNFSKTGFSYNLSFGFIKDLPVNKARNIGFGVGLGYSINAHYFNIKESTDLPEDDPGAKELKSNKIALYMVELPIQLRFRNSTPIKYKFFRFYPGLMFSYAFAQNHNLRQNEDFDVNDVININKFQYGVNLAVGYNNWNFYLYYGLTDLFNETQKNPYQIEARELKMGIALFFL